MTLNINQVYPCGYGIVELTLHLAQVLRIQKSPSTWIDIQMDPHVL